MSAPVDAGGAIVLDGVGHEYVPGQVAVRDLSLEVGAGEICVLIGPSGCGKTTTLRMINRLIAPTRGRILIGGRDTARIPPAELRRRIGYVIQGIGLFSHLTVAQNVATVPRLLGWRRERIAARVDELLAAVGLEPDRFKGVYPRRLSGGQAQRVGVARALAADPPVLLMDEPFGAVDPPTRERLQDEFLALQQALRKTVVLVTHDIDEATKMGDRVAMMRAGRLVQYDTPERILTTPADRFVRDFVGSDRALKRLARVRVEELMTSETQAARLSEGLAAARARLAAAPSVFVVDDEGRLLGWLDRDAQGSSLEEAMAAFPADEIAVRSGMSVRRALAKMVQQGFRTLPVVDSAGRLVGELTLAAIERLDPTPTRFGLG